MSNERDLLMAKVTASLNREYSGKKLLDHRPQGTREAGRF